MNDWIRLQLSLDAPGLWLILSAVSGVLLLAVGSRLPVPYRGWMRIARWLLIPYVGLLLGSLSPRLMGITGINWPATFGLGLSMTFVVLVLIMLVRSTIDAQPHVPDEETLTLVTTAHVLPPVSGAQEPISGHWMHMVQAIVTAGAEEFHWAFLRGGLWEMFTTLPVPPDNPAYSAIWGATLFTIPDLLTRSGRFPHRLLHVATILTTSILFLYTRNFWLCWGVHAAIWLLLQPEEQQATQAGLTLRR